MATTRKPAKKRSTKKPVAKKKPVRRRAARNGNFTIPSNAYGRNIKDYISRTGRLDSATVKSKPVHTAPSGDKTWRSDVKIEIVTRDGYVETLKAFGHGRSDEEAIDEALYSISMELPSAPRRGWGDDR